MKKEYIHLVYSIPHLRQPSASNVVIYQKGPMATVLLEESLENNGASLTNSIEYAVIQLAKLLGIHPEKMQLFQLDRERDAYDYVTLVNGSPSWTSFDNSTILDLITSWLQLTEEEEKGFLKDP